MTGYGSYNSHFWNVLLVSFCHGLSVKQVKTATTINHNTFYCVVPHLHLHPTLPPNTNRALKGDMFSPVTVTSAGFVRNETLELSNFHSPSHLLMFSQQSNGTEPRFNTKHPRTHPQNQSTNGRAIESAPGPTSSPRTPTARSQSDPASERQGAGIQKERGRDDLAHFNAVLRIDEYSSQGFPFLMPLGWVEP